MFAYPHKKPRSLQESWSYLHCPDIRHKWNVHTHESVGCRKTEESPPYRVQSLKEDCSVLVHCRLKNKADSRNLLDSPNWMIFLKMFSISLLPFVQAAGR